MIEFIKSKKIEGVILDFIVIVFIFIMIVLNSGDYKQVFSSNRVIFDKNSAEKMINNKKRFVTLDLENAKLTRFSLKNNDTGSLEINTYEVIYDNKILIVFLKENTVVTNKVNGELIYFRNEKNEIKNKIKEESNDKEIYEVAFSNEDYKTQEKLIKLKFITSIFIILFMFLRLLINLLYYYNPKNTRKYIKYRKKAKSK